jgi:hypothetical protein
MPRPTSRQTMKRNFGEQFPEWVNGYPQREDYDGEADYLADCERWESDHDYWEGMF